jgi:hypothetical protein
MKNPARFQRANNKLERVLTYASMLRNDRKKGKLCVRPFKAPMLQPHSLFMKHFRIKARQVRRAAKPPTPRPTPAPTGPTPNPTPDIIGEPAVSNVPVSFTEMVAFARKTVLMGEVFYSAGEEALMETTKAGMLIAAEASNDPLWDNISKIFVANLPYDVPWDDLEIECVPEYQDDAIHYKYSVTMFMLLAKYEPERFDLLYSLCRAQGLSAGDYITGVMDDFIREQEVTLWTSFRRICLLKAKGPNYGFNPHIVAYTTANGTQECVPGCHFERHCEMEWAGEITGCNGIGKLNGSISLMCTNIENVTNITTPAPTFLNNTTFNFSNESWGNGTDYYGRRRTPAPTSWGRRRDFY